MWKEYTLNEVCDVQRGSSPRPIKQFTTENDGVNWIKISDTTQGGKYVSSTKEKITKEGAEKSRYVSAGDLILTNSMSYGRPYIMATDGYIHDGWFVLRLKEFIDAEYFYHLLSSTIVQKQFNQLAAGSVVKNISGDLVKKVIFSLPPLAEQQRIVAKLDAAFAEIEASIKRRTSQRDSVKLLLNQYLATVSAEKIKLDDLIQIKTGKLDANAMVEGGKYPFFTCSKQTFEINDYAFDCDAVLLAGNNASGDFNVKHYHGKFNAYQRTYVLTVKDENTLRSRYLYFQLIQALVQLKKMSVGANTKFLKLGMIKEFQIPLPEIEKQNFVLDKLEHLETQTKSLEENFDEQIDNLTALKSAILKQELQSSEAA